MGQMGQIPTKKIPQIPQHSAKNRSYFRTDTRDRSRRIAHTENSRITGTKQKPMPHTDSTEIERYKRNFEAISPYSDPVSDFPPTTHIFSHQTLKAMPEKIATRSRAGRPSRASEPATKQVNIRLTTTEFESLRRQADKLRTTITELMRDRAIG